MNVKIALNILNLAMKTKEAKLILNKYWLEENIKSSIHTTGFCYNATEALSHLINNNEFKPYVASYLENNFKCTHWWLQNKKGNRLDPTFSQYYPDKPPYHLGKPCGFLTGNKISKRSKILMDIALSIYEDKFNN